MASAHQALSAMPAPAPDDGAGVVVATGTFSAAIVVSDAPEGTASPILKVSDGRISMVAGDETAASSADVTIALSWHDAVALFDGSLVAAQAIAEGRVRVRGDLSVLRAAQDLLGAARPALGSIRASTEI
ncbi:MAG: SCP2 sterol-binding domain-containing protein [Acidimicrobiales bacterium]